MKNLLGLLLILLIGFTSCEGKKTTAEALSESIDAFKKSVNLEVNVYIPETYLEHEVDSLLSNGYRVKIKTYADMANAVLFTKIKDTINYQTHYRNFKFEVSVLKNDELIYSNSFDKAKVNKAFNYKPDLTSDSLLYNFDTLAVLKSIQINDDPSFKNKVAIDILYSIPETDRYASHRLFIDEIGTSHIEHIEVK